jgi:hypothetical protein
MHPQVKLNLTGQIADFKSGSINPLQAIILPAEINLYL